MKLDKKDQKGKEPKCIGSVELKGNDPAVLLNPKDRSERKQIIIKAFIGEVESTNIKNGNSVPKGYYRKMEEMLLEVPGLIGRWVEAYMKGEDSRCRELGKLINIETLKRLDSPSVPSELQGKTHSTIATLMSQGTKAIDIRRSAQRRKYGSNDENLDARPRGGF